MCACHPLCRGHVSNTPPRQKTCRNHDPPASASLKLTTRFGSYCHSRAQGLSEYKRRQKPHIFFRDPRSPAYKRPCTTEMVEPEIHCWTCGCKQNMKTATKRTYALKARRPVTCQKIALLATLLGPYFLTSTSILPWPSALPDHRRCRNCFWSLDRQTAHGAIGAG